MTYTKETFEKAKQWKELAEEYNLTMFEMYELVNHYEQIQKLLNKKVDQC